MPLAMIPQTDIIYNYEYAKRLYRGDENFTVEVTHRDIDKRPRP